MLDRIDVLDLIGRQHGVVSIAQLCAKPLLLAPSTVKRARRRGSLVTVLPGILALTGHELTLHGKAMALLLRAGPGSFLSGRTAALLHGMRGMPDEPIEITQREDRQLGLPSWASYSRTSWFDDDEGAAAVVEIHGLRVASPLRTLFGLASLLDQRRFERAAEDAWHLGLVTPETANEYLQEIRRSGKTGVAKFQTWLERTAARPPGRPSQSHLERDMIAALVDEGLPEPVRQHPLRLASGETIHIDLAWPKVRLGVEPGHTWWHGGDERMRRDQARDRGCAELGWLITRLDEEDRSRLPAIARQIARAYRMRQTFAG